LNHQVQGGVKSTPPAPALNGGKSEAKQSAAKDTWAAYASAMFKRYGSEPRLNGRAMGMCAQLVERLGKDDAPFVVAFYVSHNARWYVEKGHSLGALVADAEKVCMEWKTGRKVTSTGARMSDESQQRAGVWGPMIAKAEKEEQERGKG
jgi:hypothetical protein